jgi:hypothetical protein
MPGGIRQRNLNQDWRLYGVFASAAAYLTARNKASATEGDGYYNTTLNQLRTYDGSNWSPAGMSGIGSGSLDAAANIGTKITIDSGFSGGIEIEADNAIISTNGQLLLLDNNDTGSDIHCLEMTDAGTAASIQITSAQASDDIQGTSDTWAITSAGVIDGSGLTLKTDNDNISLGTSTDMTISFNDGAPGTAGNGMLIQGTAAVEQVQFGDGTYEVDVMFIGNTATSNFMHFDGDGGADSVGSLIFDNIDLDLGDGDLIRLGDSQDFTLGNTSGSPNILKLLGDDQQFDIGAAGAGMDVYWYTETSGNHVFFDEDNELVDFLDVNIDLDDEALLRFGTSNDFTIQNIAGSPNILRITGDDEQLDFGVSGGGFDMYWYTEDATNYVYWDEDNSRMDMIDVDLRLDDDARLYFGSDADAYFVWDDTNSEVDMVGDLNITGTLTVSGAFDIGNFSFGDDEELRFGNSDDFVFQYDSATSNMAIDAAAANDTVDVGLTVNTDWIYHGGGAGKDAHWDSSENTLGFLDDAVLSFGGTAASPDVEISWDQTRLNITGTGNQIRIGADDEGMDVLFYGESASAQMLWDESADQLVFAGAAQISLNDNVELLFGTGSSNAGDFKMDSDGSNLYIREISATGKNLLLGESGKGLAVRFYGDTAGSDLLWVQASDMLEFQDDAKLAFGTTSDVTIVWDQTNLLIEPASQGVGIIKIGATAGMDFNIYADDAAKFASFDSGAAELLLDGYDIGLQDDDIIQFGDANDITMTWDQTQLMITGATANNPIRIGDPTNLDLIICGGTTTNNVTFDTDDSALVCEFDGFDLHMKDDDVVKFGDASDITMTWDQTQLMITGASVNNTIIFGDPTNVDVIIAGGTTTNTVTFDTDDSALLCKFNGFDLQIEDDDILQFGDAGTTDCYITWDQTQLQIVPSSNVYIGDKTNYVSISSAGVLTQTGTATITCNLNTTSFSGLVLPTHASSSPDGSKTGTTGAIYYEQDASVLWVCESGTTWVSTAALS